MTGYYGYNEIGWWGDYNFVGLELDDSGIPIDTVISLWATI